MLRHVADDEVRQVRATKLASHPELIQTLRRAINGYVKALFYSQILQHPLVGEKRRLRREIGTRRPYWPPE